MRRFGWLVCCVLALGCQHGDDTQAQAQPQGAPPVKAPAPGTPPQSAEELQAPLAKIDDVTITLGEFEDRLNRQSPYIRARYTSLEQKKELDRKSVV